MPIEAIAQGEGSWRAAYLEGRFEDCFAIASGLRQKAPQSARNWRLLGISQLFLKRPRDAEESLLEAAALAPNEATIWDNLGLALQMQERHGEALVAIGKSLALAPNNAGAWSNLSASTLCLGRAGEALQQARTAVDLAPSLADARLSLGNAYSSLGESDAALDALREALRLRPRFPQAMLSLGRELGRRGQLADSVRVTRQALEIQTDFPEAHVNLGCDMNSLGDIAAATEHYRAALRLSPNMLSARSGLLYCLLHDDALSPDTLLAEHLAFGAQAEAVAVVSDLGYANVRDPERRLRLGFVSGDLRDHPVARFIEPIWRQLDGSQFEVLAYDNLPARDETARRLRALVPQWVDVSILSDAQLVQRIRNDGIDILLDLSGHTAANRLSVFAARPAPIQVTWIGYPGTTGLRAMDYRLVDAVAAPPGLLDAQFTERLAYLPVMSVFERPASLPDVGPLPALVNGYLTFGSFNRINKLGPATLKLWAKLLHSVADARLLIGAVPNDESRESLLQGLNGLGIAPERVAMRSRMPMENYLRLHGEVDILLDTIPFSSGTTANFALWMGVPTLTLAGRTLAQRLGASRMAAAGLHDFVADSPEMFVDRGLRWATRIDELSRLRTRLRQRMEDLALTMPERATAVLAERLREMWRLWCAGEPPRVLG